ncbi:helix-turn-helix transcriptional regulator [Frondihabitans peucedani]|uniref:Helix-turn-helix transcriptional regulator n=1 Tax=Frondihabitans peucedani TaxID=598626 RepID=A0ABP8E1W2_9MICO
MAERENGLGDFLRARRALLDPAAFGIRSGGGRRVEGLRRDELAHLAGVSPHYYARLEQGRARHPSRSVLDALARVLDLSDEARAHLAGLTEGSVSLVGGSRESETVTPELQQLVAGWPQQPAAVVGRYGDVLFSNELAQALTPWFAPGNNLLHEAFLNIHARTFYVDWEQVASGAVAALRSSAGSDTGHPRLLDLVEHLSARSDDFRRIWARHDVLERTSGTKRYFIPLVGQVTLSYQTFTVNEAPDQTLYVFFAEPGSPDEDALRLLSSLVEPVPSSQARTRRAPAGAGALGGGTGGI